MVQFLPDERQTKTTSQDFYDIWHCPQQEIFSEGNIYEPTFLKILDA